MKNILILISVVIIFSGTTFAQSFTGSFDLISMQKYQNGNVRYDTISYFIDKDRSAIIIRPGRNQPDMKMIFDFKANNICNLFEMNSKKSGFIFPMNEKYWPGISTARYKEPNSSNRNYKVTGKSRIIEDHKCKEITAESDDYKATLWVAEDIPYSLTNILSYQSVGKGKSREEIEMYNKFGINFLPLDLMLESKTGKADVKISIINLEDNFSKDVFSTDGYTLSTINSE